MTKHQKPLTKYMIGIDEVGRGPIAGPVAVGAFVFLRAESRKLFKGVKESKQLNEAKREEWFVTIEQAKKDGHIDFAVSFQGESLIDRRGVSFCIRKALATSLDKLGIKPIKARILLDGGLRAPVYYRDQKTIIKGDEKEMVIALASICAKVLRDRKMIGLSKKYPQYGFAEHKGYGTREHYEAIRVYGTLPNHRKNFLKSRNYFN